MLLNIKQEQVNELYERAPSGTVGQILVTLLVAYILYGGVSNIMLFSWASFMLVVLFLRVPIIITYNKRIKLTPNVAHLNKWILSYQANVLFTGIGWGSISFLFADQFQLLDVRLGIAIVIFAVAGIGIASLGSVFSVYVLYSVPMVLMMSINFLLSGLAYHFEIGLLALVGLMFLLIATYQFNKRTYDFIKKTHDLTERTHEVERSQLEIIERLGRAGEYKDNETGLHVKRMSHSSYLLAIEYGLTEKQANQILMASPMHDIGKIGIPDRILLKNGKLTSEEWDVMKTHATIGAELLDKHESPLLQMASSIAANHHEKWDGSGYPLGLTKQEIPIEARIVSICDVFDALVSERPYKEAWSLEAAFAFIKDQSGKHFDPELVEHFFSVSPQIVEYGRTYQDT